MAIYSQKFELKLWRFNFKIQLTNITNIRPKYLGKQKIKVIIAFTLVIILFLAVPNKLVPESFCFYRLFRTIYNK